MTKLRATGKGRVAVELDGAPWRTMPLEVALKAGLDVGVEVDRPCARRLRMELRRAHAIQTALAALRHHDHSRQSLRDRLDRAGVTPSTSHEALATLERGGLVNDARAALARASALAAREAGDSMIRDDLERGGFPAEVVARAIGALQPEWQRAAEIAGRRGQTPATYRRLASRGFSSEVLDTVVATTAADELG